MDSTMLNKQAFLHNISILGCLIRVVWLERLVIQPTKETIKHIRDFEIQILILNFVDILSN
jgi:hypothetical protein